MVCNSAFEASAGLATSGAPRHRLRIVAAFAVGLVVGTSGLATAGALPDGAQEVAQHCRSPRLRPSVPTLAQPRQVRWIRRRPVRIRDVAASGPGTLAESAPPVAAHGSLRHREAADVYQQLAPAVLGYVRSQGVPEPEDLLGAIFLQVVRGLSRFSGDGAALRRWVFTIAHHRIVVARRRAGRRPAVDGGAVPDMPAPSSPDPFDPDLVRVLGQLTADQREVMALRFVADLPIETVAALTGRKPKAVKALQHRALEALAGILGVERGGTTPPGDWPAAASYSHLASRSVSALAAQVSRAAAKATAEQAPAFPARVIASRWP
jgi:RNA polymerase sigma-70 factor (ECF subfamily)